ncbi:uncharacterized protein N7479_000223 [Penicillium vulpinum]|nr:uncharacterized protein N7479_000223 [Penicillium vulpinum]KAJ5970305.1 hypothetical protein N7479_000223 [Penicillium vulpinum]
MPTHKRKRDTVVSSMYTTEQKPSVEEWLAGTTQKIGNPVIAQGLNVLEKRIANSERQPSMDKEPSERDHKRDDEIKDRIKYLKELVRRQNERLKRSELQGNTAQPWIQSLQEQLSMRDSMLYSLQQHTDLRKRLGMHERLLEISDQQINAQQELIKHLLEAQATTSRQLALVSQNLSQQPEKCVQQPQVEEPEEKQYRSVGVNTSTDASDYVLVSEDEATS